MIEWVVQTGEQVAEDQVLCVLETDKVTVDVRSTASGVLVKQFAGVDDEIMVGDPLALLDDAATASAAPSGGGSAAAEEAAAPAAAPAAAAAPEPVAAAPAPPAAAPAPAPPSASPAAAPSVGRRVPMIKFKYGVREEEYGQSAFPHWAVTDQADLGEVLPPMFGRPALSEAEMEAVEGFA